jgi:hypothetical protein
VVVEPGLPADKPEKVEEIRSEVFGAVTLQGRRRACEAIRSDPGEGGGLTAACTAAEATMALWLFAAASKVKGFTGSPGVNEHFVTQL